MDGLGLPFSLGNIGEGEEAMYDLPDTQPSSTDSRDRVVVAFVFRPAQAPIRLNLDGGNQRELARAKNAKKKDKKAAGEQESNKGLTLEQRKQRDADRMREKQLQKEKEAAECSKQAVK
ncbi:hypothetical protein QAD02_014525 [Eretmocerus hayati]|uniref:Uncharacterized protein n=1 Tax=Eretmocerus hayati TaxID=131215 RepID=A0ACC2P6K6_9HYME|nr:hypothetical protein QAD02_014525 [Eretmocerus hayati]